MTARRDDRSYPLLYVVVLNWNSWRDTIACLGTLFESDYPNYRVVVCDNASEDGSLEYVKAWAEGRLDPVVISREASYRGFSPPKGRVIRYVEHDRSCADRNQGMTKSDASLVLIQAGENLGYGGGNNVALSYAFRGTPEAHALILNNDLFVPPNFLSRAMEGVLDGAMKGAAVVGFPAYHREDPEFMECAYLEESFTRGPRQVTKLPQVGKPFLEGVMAHGAAMLITPDAPVKLLPDDYFLYYEDADYCRQIYESGGRVAIQLDNPVYHSPSKTVGAGSPTQIYYTRRSKLAYCRKYNSTMEYSIVLARMMYSTLRGWLRSSRKNQSQHAKAYRLSLWHHLSGKKGRTWV